MSVALILLFVLAFIAGGVASIALARARWRPAADRPAVEQAPDTSDGRKPDDLQHVWAPDPLRATTDAGYFQALTGWLAEKLPNASLSDAIVFEDADGRWLASNCWSFDTHTRELRRVPLDPREPLP